MPDSDRCVKASSLPGPRCWALPEQVDLQHLAPIKINWRQFQDLPIQNHLGP